MNFVLSLEVIKGWYSLGFVKVIKIGIKLLSLACLSNSFVLK